MKCATNTNSLFAVHVTHSTECQPFYTLDLGGCNKSRTAIHSFPLLLCDEFNPSVERSTCPRHLPFEALAWKTSLFGKGMRSSTQQPDVVLKARNASEYQHMEPGRQSRKTYLKTISSHVNSICQTGGSLAPHLASLSLSIGRDHH
jgi:hypothetical protein